MRPRPTLAIASAALLAVGLASVILAAPAQADPLAGSQVVLTNVQSQLVVSSPTRSLHTEFDAVLPAGGTGTVRITARVRGGCSFSETTVVDTVTITADGHYSEDLAVPYTGYVIADVDASDGTGNSAPQGHTEFGISALDAAAAAQGDFVISFTPDAPPNTGTIGFSLGEVGPAGADFDIAVDGAPVTTGLQIADCGLQYVPWSAVADGSTIDVSNHNTHEVLASFTVPGTGAGAGGGSGSGSAPGDPALAQTGVDAAPAATWGIGLLAAGLLVMLLIPVRRRRASRA